MQPSANEKDNNNNKNNNINNNNINNNVSNNNNNNINNNSSNNNTNNNNDNNNINNNSSNNNINNNKNNNIDSTRSSSTKNGGARPSLNSMPSGIEIINCSDTDVAVESSIKKSGSLTGIINPKNSEKITNSDASRRGKNSLPIIVDIKKTTKLPGVIPKRNSMTQFTAKKIEKEIFPSINGSESLPSTTGRRTTDPSPLNEDELRKTKGGIEEPIPKSVAVDNVADINDASSNNKNNNNNVSSSSSSSKSLNNNNNNDNNTNNTNTNNNNNNNNSSNNNNINNNNAIASKMRVSESAPILNNKVTNNTKDDIAYQDNNKNNKNKFTDNTDNSKIDNDCLGSDLDDKDDNDITSAAILINDNQKEDGCISATGLLPDDSSSCEVTVNDANSNNNKNSNNINKPDGSKHVSNIAVKERDSTQLSHKTDKLEDTAQGVSLDTSKLDQKSQNNYRKKSIPKSVEADNVADTNDTFSSNNNNNNNNSDQSDSVKRSRKGSLRNIFAQSKKPSFFVGDDEGKDLTNLEQLFLRGVAQNDGAITADCLKKNVNLDVKNGFGRDAMQIAARNGSIPMLSMVLQAGGSISTRGAKGDTLFHLAAYNGHLSTMKWLKSNGILPESVDLYGQTAMHIACRRAELEVLIYLNEAIEADFTQQDFDGLSPLECLPRFGKDDEEKVNLADCKKVVMSAVANIEYRRSMKEAAELRWKENKAIKTADEIKDVVLSATLT
eukprot:CAMPEP_0119052398 /NCGR_PEP_ID=MMETSP1177-20130426/73701_1 /TAXON_ID=2985 /ORGANISM="Ochromonas sp, Strain CCMP1899" /LENGTH=724 /DNA_ID=CAMNT_0007031951 /DNA_START=2705 /DNA_END=4879 /DNA_ORIENTATION=-